MSARDPWFPIALVLTTVLGMWLVSLGPLPFDVWASIQKWQTLIAALVALIAASIAYWNTTRTLSHNEDLERRRRTRKHAAVRAVLPLALSQVTQYAEQSARGLNDLVGQCVGPTLPLMAAPDTLVQSLPPDTLKALTDFIEYSDEVDIAIIESTVAWIQIHDARLRDIIKRNRDPNNIGGVARAEIEASIIDAATIYAGVAAVFEYARRRGTQLAHDLPWEGVRGALRNMRFWDDEHPRVYQIIAGREHHSAGPFERLNANAGG